MPAVTTVQLRRGTASEWNTANPVLAVGEIGYETDTGYFKIGNGSTKWNGAANDGVNKLPYSDSGAHTPTSFSLSSGAGLTGGSFNGSQAVTISVANPLPDTISVAGNAATATQFAGSPTINGTTFRGTSNVVISGALYGGVKSTAGFRDIYLLSGIVPPSTAVPGDVWISW